MRYVRLYRLFFAQYMKTLMASKVDFFMGFLAFSTTQFFGLVFLFVVFGQIPSLSGWDFYEILFVYGFAQIPRGIDHVLTDNIWLLARDYVKLGTFDRYLVRPINIFFHLCADRFQPDGFGELIVGVVIVAIAAPHVSLTVTPLMLLLFLVSILLGSVIYTAIKLFFASLAFWIKDAMPLLGIAYNMADFAKYPITIYNAPIQFCLTFIIPFAAVAYFPAAFFLGRVSIWQGIGLEAIVACISFAIAYSFFKLGMARYESAGS